MKAHDDAEDEIRSPPRGSTMLQLRSKEQGIVGGFISRSS